ncbi:hypothetical protein MVEG_08619 [Podila verticillata NRRL 6337]|nr:hypothetical protein MVEG_08619 [Podila verticillata NRRL 6337]
MSSPGPSRWRTVGPHWSSVRPSTPSSHSSPVPDTPPPNPGATQKMSMHSFGMATAYHTYHSDLHRYPSNHFDQASYSHSHSDNNPVSDINNINNGNQRISESERALQHSRESQRQQQLYLEQLQLTQKLQSMPGSTVRAWYPTFGPAITTTCSNNTIILDNPNHYTLASNAKANRQSVGPHWRSIPPASTVYSAAGPSPRTSPRLSTRSLYNQQLPGSHHQPIPNTSNQIPTSIPAQIFPSHPSISHTPTNFNKRKAWSQDEDSDDEEFNCSQGNQDYTQGHHPSFSIPSQIQTQSRPRSHESYSPYSPIPNHGIHDMTGIETECPLLSPPLSAGVYSNEHMSSMGTNTFGDMDLGDSMDLGSGDHSSVPKRAKPRFEFGFGGGGSVEAAIELQRMQSGERVHNLLQECFYNAASR